MLYCFHGIYDCNKKTLLYCNNFFSPNEYQYNNKIINNYFKDKYDKRKRNSIVGVLVGITSSAVGLKIFAITVGIKKCKSIIKKKRK